MSPKSAGAFRRRASVGVALMVGAWAATAHAADDLTLDLGPSSLELRRIPAGTYTQGSPADEPGREADEAQRSVTLSRAFWLGKVPVTRGQFSRFVTETRHVTDAEKSQLGGFGWDGKTLAQKKEFTWRNPGFAQKDDDPVVLVSFGDANAFAAWASRKTGKRVRLPTEAEWEYAAKAGSTSTWAGATKSDEAFTVGWFRANATGSTHPVGRKRANAFGLFDMAGNVFEWCRDVYAPYAPGDVTDPESTTNTAGEPERRVLRGGSWLRDPKRGRSAARHRAAPGARSAESGFRVAMDDDVPLAPAPGVVPANDFAPAAPLGASSASPPLADAPASAPAMRAPASAAPIRPEGGGWSLVVAPIAAAGFAVAWVLARRRRGASPSGALAAPRGMREPAVRPAPSLPGPIAPAGHPSAVPLGGPGSTTRTGPVAPATPRPPSGMGPNGPPPPLPSQSQEEPVRGVAIVMIAEEERPSSPLASASAVPTGSPYTSEPSIMAAPATVSEALLVRASVAEAGLVEGEIVDVPLTPAGPRAAEAKEVPANDIVDVPLTPAGPRAAEAKEAPANDIVDVPLTPVVDDEEKENDAPPASVAKEELTAPSAEPAKEEPSSVKEEPANAVTGGPAKPEPVAVSDEVPAQTEEAVPAAGSDAADPKPNE